MNALALAARRLLRHKLLWAKETVLLTLAAAHVPAWLWLPLSSNPWLALHAVLPMTLALLLWFALRLARTELAAGAPIPWLGLAGAAIAAALAVWALLSIVPVFGSVELQTASLAIRALAAAVLSAGLLMLPLAAAKERGS